MYAPTLNTHSLRAPASLARILAAATAALRSMALLVHSGTSSAMRTGADLAQALRPASDISGERLELALRAARSLGYSALPVNAGGVVCMVLLRGPLRIIVLNERGRGLPQGQIDYLRESTDADHVWYLDDLPIDKLEPAAP